MEIGPIQDNINKLEDFIGVGAADEEVRNYPHTFF